MKRGSSFIDICNATILSGKPEGLEVAGYDDKDIMYIKAVAIEEGLNGNNALFLREDLHRAHETLRGKPLKIRYVGNNPTGHGYDPNTGTFDEIVKAIGVIYGVEAQVIMPDGTEEYVWGNDIPEGGKYQIVVTMGIWQKYYPEIANRLRQLHSDGELKFSIEAERDQEVTPEGYRKCFNILFNGLAVVKNPAFDNARSLVVAELLNKGGKDKMDFEKMYQELSAKHEVLVKANGVTEQRAEVAEAALTAEQAKVTELSEQVVTLTGDVKTVSAERDTFKTTVENAEKLVVGADRLAKLSKYGEVDKKADELAEMSKEAFVDLLAEMVDGFTPSGQENAEKDGLMGAYHNTDKHNTSSNKQNLLALVTGLVK